MKNSKIFQVLAVVLRWVNIMSYGWQSCVNFVRKRATKTEKKYMSAKKLTLPNESYILRIQSVSSMYNLYTYIVEDEITTSTEENIANKRLMSPNGLCTLQTQCTFDIYDLGYLKTQHQKLDKAFSDGWKNNRLFIESSEQIFESFKTYHQYEMNTLPTLWRIYALQRKLLSNIREASYETC